uniref:Corticotropin-releasing factor domain-containing protein n=1 Tax=Falco tinnunculus TaxID=100819 RepID=A0A8C4TUD2_FALTI
MRIRMISAASVLVLLFLPSETCSPLQWPRGPLCQPRGAEPTPAPRSARGLQTGKRRDGKPNSLDLTFHLLREFLEMSREERLAQKALSNKLLLQSIGK